MKTETTAKQVTPNALVELLRAERFPGIDIGNYCSSWNGFRDLVWYDGQAQDAYDQMHREVASGYDIEREEWPEYDGCNYDRSGFRCYELGNVIMELFDLREGHGDEAAVEIGESALKVAQNAGIYIGGEDGELMRRIDSSM